MGSAECQSVATVPKKSIKTRAAAQESGYGGGGARPQHTGAGASGVCKEVGLHRSVLAFDTLLHNHPVTAIMSFDTK